jgi:uncharacterized protein involved in response to NO
MFFGFGWAVLGGFLLTSTKNWVQIRGYHGARWSSSPPPGCSSAPAWVRRTLAGLAVRAVEQAVPRNIVAMLLWTLIRHRATDSYRDNYFFLLILPAFLVAKQLMLERDISRPASPWPSACSASPSWSCWNAP